MLNISYQHIRPNEEGAIENVVAYDPNSSQPVKQADSNHPHFEAILDGLRRNDHSVFSLFDVGGGVAKKMRAVSDRISYNGSQILFDGDPQEGPLADHLLRCLESGVQDYAPVARFWEKVAQNPDKRSREQLFTWLQNCDFTITEDGDILGYKGVKANGGNYHSISQGTAWVDGEEVTGAIPNNIGVTVTMPRAKVRNDPNTHCSDGLHVGDWSYASGFARGAVLEVHVNPRDVVSIPNDSSYRKMRVCKYKVVKVRTEKHGAPIAHAESNSWQGDVGYRV